MSRKQKICYSRQEGLKFLPELSFTDLNGSAVVQNETRGLSIAFIIQGASNVDDLAAFNTAVSLFSLDLDSTAPSYGMTALRIQVPCLKTTGQQGDDESLTPDTEIAGSLRIALRFFVSLGIATNTIVTWQKLSAAPLNIKAFGEGAPQKLEFQEKYIEFTQPVVLHAGHLLMAVEVFSRLQEKEWPDRFYELYEKGMMLFFAPEVQALNFREESYQCFYKCLEYVVMGRVLAKRGDYGPKELARAFEKLGIKCREDEDTFSEAVKSGNTLSKTRGNKVSHFTFGNESITLDPKETFELKGVVDFLIRGYTARGL